MVRLSVQLYSKCIDRKRVVKWSCVGKMCLQGLKERLTVLQSLVAELELDQKRLNKKNFHLENQKDKLKRATHTLRETLQQVYTTMRPVHVHAPRETLCTLLH